VVDEEHRGALGVQDLATARHDELDQAVEVARAANAQPSS
jgi:hypothetical protein